ncbi:unnamed protein product [Calypogeia fissa]
MLPLPTSHTFTTYQLRSTAQGGTSKEPRSRNQQVSLRLEECIYQILQGLESWKQRALFHYRRGHNSCT